MEGVMGIALRTVSRLIQPLPSLFSKKDKKRQLVTCFSTSATSAILDRTRVVGTPGKGCGAAGKRVIVSAQQALWSGGESSGTA
jgi:hypothetical protein